MDKKIISLVTSGVLLLSLVGAALAQKPSSNATFTPGQSGKSVSIPEGAVEVAPGIYDIGTTRDVDGRIVQGYMVFHHKPGHDGGPGGGGGNNGGGDTTSSCYAFLSNGARWNNVEPWEFNTANEEGLDETNLFYTLDAAITEWENAADNVSDILGEGSTTNNQLVADTQSTDGTNEVYFGSISEPGAIAVTIVWGVFNGPPWQRRLVEWDQVYDQVDFNWSTSGDPNKMDFENIAQHELGHSIGLGHPDNSCTEETMYAYAVNGETKKRDLNNGDIAGTADLY